MNPFEVKNACFNKLATALREAYSGIFVTGEHASEVPKFPAVTFSESTNTVYEQAITDVKQNAIRLAYEINIYTNTVGKKELEARNIANTVDSTMLGIGFIRTMCIPVSNFADATIYRLTLRYEGVAMPEIDGDNTTYRIYTK